MAPALSPDGVVRAATAWVWYPPEARVVETGRYLLVLFPEHFSEGLDVLRTAGPVDDTLVDEVLGRARAMPGAGGLQHLRWWVKLDAPPGLEAHLRARGELQETLSVLARSCDGDLPDLSVPSEVEVRPVRDLPTARGSHEVEAAVFGGEVPGAAVLDATAAQGRSERPGSDVRFVAVLDGDVVGTAGLTVVDGVARLWGGAVVPAARRRGVYRALLDVRLRRAAARGARMALVKGRVATSAPVLRRAGFVPYGEERGYLLGW